MLLYCVWKLGFQAKVIFDSIPALTSKLCNTIVAVVSWFKLPSTICEYGVLFSVTASVGVSLNTIGSVSLEPAPATILIKKSFYLDLNLKKFTYNKSIMFKIIKLGFFS